jgi:hypothetical protein
MKKPSGIYAGRSSPPGAGPEPVPRDDGFGEGKLRRELVNFDQLGRIPVHTRIVHRFFLTGEGEP